MITRPVPPMDAGFFVLFGGSFYIWNRRRIDMQVYQDTVVSAAAWMHMHSACRYPFTFYGSCCIIFKSAELNAGRRRMKKWNS